VNASLSRLGSTAEDYERIGISSGQVAPRDDGARTDGSAGTYEWWYFDALDDGAKLVVVFFTMNLTDISEPLAPMIRIDLDLPDGTSYNKIAEFKSKEFSTSHERCDVRIGGTGADRAIASGPAFADYLDLARGQIRRYGCAEPPVCLALLRLLDVAATVVTDPPRRTAIADQTHLVLASSETQIAQEADLHPVRALAAHVLDATQAHS
jgi:hypothetical protein